ncbi:hypothetical protein ACMT1E_13040 [Sphingomonas flavalba]|uniref:hypothetical protein n=1 Tax=Sphingomonas flavalba TaxID=2559804 RepID=UPI0039E15C7A
MKGTIFVIQLHQLKLPLRQLDAVYTIDSKLNPYQVKKLVEGDGVWIERYCEWKIALSHPPLVLKPVALMRVMMRPDDEWRRLSVHRRVLVDRGQRSPFDPSQRQSSATAGDADFKLEKNVRVHAIGVAGSAQSK